MQLVQYIDVMISPKCAYFMTFLKCRHVSASSWRSGWASILHLHPIPGGHHVGEPSCVQRWYDNAKVVYRGDTVVYRDDKIMLR